MAPTPAWAEIMRNSTRVADTISNDGDGDEMKTIKAMKAMDLRSRDDASGKAENKARYTSISSKDLKHLAQLERSFSQSDLARFNISDHTSDNESDKNSDQVEAHSTLNGLRADFVHLQGLQTHGGHFKKDQYLRNGSREGFKLRSFHSFYYSKDNQDDAPKTIVIIPSIDLDRKELNRMCQNIDFYEERQLYHLLLTRDPSIRVIFFSSNRVDESVVGYYLRLCQDEQESVDSFSDVHNKLARVFMIHVPSSKCISLSEKILEEKKLTRFLKDLVESPFYGNRNSESAMENTNASAGLSVFTGSNSVSKIANQIGIRLLEAHDHQLHYGTKQGSREIFQACGVPFPPGTPDLSAGDDDLLTYGDQSVQDESPFWAYKHRYIRSSRCLAIGLARQIARGVHPSKWVVKLNQGFSGKGNASVDLRAIQNNAKALIDENNKYIIRIDDIADQIEKRFETSMKFEDSTMSWKGSEKHYGFKKQIERLGVIAEAFIEGEVPTSPSIQAVVEPGDGLEEGSVSIISTHEQLLKGQVYQGCINPAASQYRDRIMEIGLKVGNYMKSRGVVGHFSVDFLASKKSDGTWDLNAVEINLRQGGTTHPLATMSLLCGGCICSDGIFRTNDNQVRVYVATDNHAVEKLKGCSQSILVDAIESKTNPLAIRIYWNKTERVGVVFHLFKFVELQGRIGFTAIGRTREESDKLFKEAVEFLDDFGDSFVRRSV